MSRVLITGACGFCARHLADRLALDPETAVFGADIRRSEDALSRLADFRQVDFTDSEAVSALVADLRPDIVFHLAGAVRGRPESIYAANLLGGVNLLEAVKEYAAEARVIVAGSAAEYGHVPEEDMPITEEQACQPVGAYGISKYALTLACLEYARNSRNLPLTPSGTEGGGVPMRVSVVRPFNIIGAGVPATLVVGAIIERAKDAIVSGRDTVIVGNLDTYRDFVAVEDVVDAYIALAGVPDTPVGRPDTLVGQNLPLTPSETEGGGVPNGEVYNICSGKPTSIRFVVETLLSFAPRPLRPVVDPNLVRGTDVKTVYGSWKKARDAFGFEPKTDLTAALRSAWDAGSAVVR